MHYFEYLQDDPFKIKTNLIRDTDNPEYDQKIPVEIQRSSRTCQRIFKRQAVKFEVYSKGWVSNVFAPTTLKYPSCLGNSRACWCDRKFPIFSCFSGFLRSDILIGTVTIKLLPLETQVEIHDSFPVSPKKLTKFKQTNKNLTFSAYGWSKNCWW